MRLAWVLVVGLVPATARADDPAPVPGTTTGDAAPAIPVPAVPAMAGPGAVAPSGAPATPATVAEPRGLDRRRRDDAAVGRSYFAETALTTPRGRVTVDLRAPALPVLATGVRVGVTDRLEVGGTLVTIADEATLAGLSIKGQLWRGQRTAIAAGVNTYSAAAETLYDAHLEGTTCLDAGCVAAATLSLNLLGFTDEDTMPVLAGAGLSAGRAVQFIGELHQTRDGGHTVTMGYVGLRAAGARLSLDGGIAFGFDSSSCVDCSDDGGAFPFFGVAGRL